MENVAARSIDTKDRWVLFDHGQGTEIGKLLRLNRHVAVFETYAPSGTLQTSQVLQSFKVVVQARTLYAGRAVVRSLINAGVAIVSEVSLDDDWVQSEVVEHGRGVREGFGEFLEEWQKVYQVRPEFKVVVADLHSFLSDLRLWLDQFQLGSGGGSEEARDQWERSCVRELEPILVPAINRLHEQFEETIEAIEPGARPAHQHFARRHLHGLFLSSPFGRRAYQKPLGYAGDYEMVNMIMGEPYVGDSLFAKAMNVWLLRQYPSEAHRNRIRYLVDRLIGEGLRLRSTARPMRVLSLGCGPAHEVQTFLTTSALGDTTEFDLLDINDETLNHLRSVLVGLQHRHARRSVIRIHKRSVFSLLKDSGRVVDQRWRGSFDLIFCAGLFDYLNDAVCRQLTGVCHEWLAPGGLLVVTNVDTRRPFRHMLEFLLDWHLVYRDRRQLNALIPPAAVGEECRINSDTTGVNLFLEVRKGSSN